METQILDGKATALAIRAELAKATAKLKPHNVKPGLVVILVGEDPASQVYVRNKDRAASGAGFEVNTIRLPETVSQQALEAEVERLNQDPNVHGILVQLPLPGTLDAGAVVDCLDPAKDVDGLSPRSVAAWTLGRPGHKPCTPAGCIELLDRHSIDISGQHMVIVGRSMLVGKPLAALAMGRNATVTVCHSRTQDLAVHCRQADVLVAAVGRAKLIQGDWVRSGAIVLDVGINRGEDGKLVGDADQDGMMGRASALTPVPGGIGPMTIAMLIRNTFCGAARSVGLDPEVLLAEAAACTEGAEA
ncbi:MAG: bifunctional methylenetetrahydrofolate dehydrogenase/methenyltetrahydrofolate cyclohydrolase [Planctomycetes bacterium]|nr:bifunctional methylenetetrahydrofolate dehydrogenase/methenyltetrahydrofolate cyclohydrolase [Planctomycetota bacterium]